MRGEGGGWRGFIPRGGGEVKAGKGGGVYATMWEDGMVYTIHKRM